MSTPKKQRNNSRQWNHNENTMLLAIYVCFSFDLQKAATILFSCIIIFNWVKMTWWIHTFEMIQFWGFDHLLFSRSFCVRINGNQWLQSVNLTQSKHAHNFAHVETCKQSGKWATKFIIVYRFNSHILTMPCEALTQSFILLNACRSFITRFGFDSHLFVSIKRDRER